MHRAQHSAAAARARRTIAATPRFEERLALLVDRELSARSDRKRTRLLQRAPLKYGSASIEDAQFGEVRGIDRKTLTSLALSNWIERGDAILFGGATGLGKTWLACALGRYACRQGHSTLYVRMPRLPEELRMLHGAGAFGKWLVPLARTDVLILDDWGPGNRGSNVMTSRTCSSSASAAACRRSTDTLPAWLRTAALDGIVIEGTRYPARLAELVGR